jgi:hypothetical protein
VGAAEEPNKEQEDDCKQTNKSEDLPFSRSAILQHLERSRSSLLELCATRRKAGQDDLTDALERATALLSELQEDFAAGGSMDAQKLEQSLSGLERMLSDGIRSVVSTELVTAIEGEVKEQLKPYRKHMEAPVYRQTFDNLLLKRLREQFGVPRLSLFYL